MTQAASQARAWADDPIGRLRVTSRLTAAYLLDTVAIVRGGEGHVIDTLLASAIIQANVAEIGQHADLQVQYAESDALPTDDMRRPVSMNALAASLGIPFETVRRRVSAMVKSGHCAFADGGVIVPTAVLARPHYYVQAFRAYERLRAFYYELRDLGLLPELPPPSVDLAGGTFPVRAVSRLAGSYVLRIVEMMGSAGTLAEGDLVDTLILLEVFRSNVEHVPHDNRGGEGFEIGDMIRDDQRRPVAVSALARRVGLPLETVRRRVASLKTRGACRRVSGGLIIPADALANSTLPRALAGNAANLARLFGSLSRLGVLQIWDTLPPPEQ
jgi:hypothetical protein